MILLTGTVVLDIREQVLRPQHPDIAASLDTLAKLYHAQGQYEQAEPLIKRALAIREQALGPQHPDIFRSLKTLALHYYALGKYTQAMPLYQRILAICEHEMGPEHPDTAQNLNTLALLYRIQSKFAQSESLIKRALAIRERVLGPEHPDTAISLINMALVHFTQDKYEQAKLLYQRAFAINEKALESEPAGTVAGHNSLYEESLGLGPGDLDTIISLNDLGLQLHEMREVAVAHSFFEQILKTLKRPPASIYPHPLEQQIAIEEVLTWLRSILEDMDLAQTSRSKLTRTTALNRAIGTLSDFPPQLNHFPQAGQLFIRRVTDRWREVVTHEAGRVGKMEKLEHVRSPYIFTPPVRGTALVGRDDIFDRITSLWAHQGQRNSLIIHGHRRMGKTSVAQELESRCNLSDNTHFIYITLEGQVLDQEGDFFYLLSSEIWLRFRNQLIQPYAENFSGDNVRIHFNIFLKLLDEKIENSRIILLLDEFEYIYNRLDSIKANQVIAYLRGRTVTYSWLALALIGLSDLDDLSLSYGSSVLGWESIRISFLDAEQVKYVLANPPQDPDFPLDYTLEALESIVTHTNGQPYLVQVIGDRLVQRYNRIVFTEQRKHSGRFDVSDVEAVLADPGFYDTAAAYFDGVWGQATRGQPGELRLLKVLAENEAGLNKITLRSLVHLDNSIFEQALKALCRHEVLCSKDNPHCHHDLGDLKKDNVHYAVPLMRYWVQNTHLKELSTALTTEGEG